MNLQLFRIDDRLIHGQVVMGWVQSLNSSRIILCDNDVAANEWEKELYCSCVSENLESMVMSVKDTSIFLQTHNTLDKTIVLVRSPKVLMELVDSGYQPETVNIGGIHFANHRVEYLPYLYLNQEEKTCLQDLQQQGITFFCQDVPGGKKYSLSELKI